jgi:hypothetical protein
MDMYYRSVAYDTMGHPVFIEDAAATKVMLMDNSAGSTRLGTQITNYLILFVV